MTRPKARALGPAGPAALTWWEGEFVPTDPDIADALAGSGIDAGELAQWLRGPLAGYRMHQRARELRAQRGAVAKWLQAAAEDVGAALSDGRLRRPPAWYAEPALWHAAHRMGLDWAELVRRGAPHVAIRQCLRLAIAELRRQRSAAGRPRELPRDALLSAIVDRLRAAGLGADDARERADAILIVCQVPSPEASMARAARRGRGAISV